MHGSAHHPSSSEARSPDSAPSSGPDERPSSGIVRVRGPLPAPTGAIPSKSDPPTLRPSPCSMPRARTASSCRRSRPSPRPRPHRRTRARLPPGSRRFAPSPARSARQASRRGIGARGGGCAPHCVLRRPRARRHARHVRRSPASRRARASRRSGTLAGAGEDDPRAVDGDGSVTAVSVGPAEGHGGLERAILIVDDDADIREMLAEFIEQEHSGYRVHVGARRPGAPCLILLDLMMPVMSGWDFLQEARASDVLAAIRSSSCRLRTRSATRAAAFCGSRSRSSAFMRSFGGIATKTAIGARGPDDDERGTRDGGSKPAPGRRAAAAGADRARRRAR